MSTKRLIWLLPLAAFALLVFQVRHAADLLRANLVLFRGEQMAAQMLATGRGDRRVLGVNLRDLRQASVRAPADPRIRLAVGSHYMLRGQPLSAVRWYRDAIELEPRPEIHLSLARALSEIGRGEEAATHYLAAIRLAPRLRPELPEQVLARLGLD